MATLSRAQRRPAEPTRLLPPVRPRRPTPATRRQREQRLAEARAREVHARRDLALALTRAEQTYALAVRSLGEFDAFISGARTRLQKAGYLGSMRRSGRISG